MLHLSLSKNIHAGCQHLITLTARPPFLSVASQVRYLEIDVCQWANDPGYPVEDNYILRDRDFILHLLTPLSQISSLNINCEIISVKTLQAINGLNQLKYLKVFTHHISLDGVSPEALSWTKGTSLISASIAAYELWGATLFRWIQAFGNQLENLEIDGSDFPAVTILLQNLLIFLPSFT